ncbi:MAG: cyclic nucleotide-binding domain-containing protein, partial [Myxococcales bacterium]|nr:cyclic nucleotide-binding domain-containing protein [Myxococcales bacterium]
AAAAATAAADEGRAAASAKLDPRRRSAAAASSGAAASGRAARRRSRRSAYDATVAAGSGTHTPADEQQVPTAPASAVARAAESGSIETKPVDGSARMREPSGESPIKASATASRPLLEPHIGLFQRLPPNIAATGLQQSYQKGQSIARRGERCDALLLITEGSVALTTKSVSGEVVDLGQLDAGSFFGELGVLGSGAHILDARAASDTTVLTIPKGQMRKVLKEDPDINRLVRSAYRDRLQSIVLKTSNLFSTLHDRVGRRLLKTFKPVRAKPGTRLVQEGGEAPGLFLVLVGSLRVTAKGKDGSDVELATLGHGEFFGEISLLRSRPCCADVTAINFCQLLHLAPADFHAFAEQRPSFKAGLDKEARARERENQQKLG